MRILEHIKFSQTFPDFQYLNTQVDSFGKDVGVHLLKHIL